jgi:uncharacterized membrane protein
MTFTQVMDIVTRLFEAIGVAVLVVGFVAGFVVAAHHLRRGQRQGVYREIRSYFGKSILMGLEILVAADLIRTVAVDPTMQNVLVLGLIVLIRTFLSFSLEIEMEGMVPWKRWRTLLPGGTLIPGKDRSDEAG